MDIFTESNKRIKEGFLGQRMIILPPDIRNKISLNNLLKNFYLTAIGFYPHAVYHDRERKKGSHEFILLYCTKGKGTIEIGGRRLELVPNKYIIIPYGEPHHYRSSIDDPWSIYWAHFMGSMAGGLYNRYCYKALPEVESVPYDEYRIKNFIQIINLLEDNFSDRNLEIANIKMLHFISSIIYDSDIRSGIFETSAISNSITFMKINIDKPLKINELAAQQSLSVSRYSELFKAETGLSPVKYFIQMKIQKSCQYLYFTDLSIKQVCNKVGFNDPYYFSRMFKKIMRIPPSKYKSEYKK